MAISRSSATPGSPKACVDCGATPITARRVRAFQAMPRWVRIVAFAPVLVVAVTLAWVDDERGMLGTLAAVTVVFAVVFAKRRRVEVALPNCAARDARQVRVLRPRPSR